MNSRYISFLASVIFMALFTFSTSSIAQSNYEDVVYLKNGSIIHGMIIEQVHNESITIRINDKNIFVWKMDEIMKITKEEVLPQYPSPVYVPAPATEVRPPEKSVTALPEKINTKGKG